MDKNVWKYSVNLRDLVPSEMRGKLLMEWPLSGESVSALRTGFKMGPFYLDAGHSVFTSWDVLLISHGHADHVFSVASFFMTSGLGLHCTVYAPNVRRIESMVQSTLACNYDTDSQIKLPVTFREATHGLEEPVQLGKDKYFIKIRSLSHRVPSVGYFIYKHTKKLNPLLKAIKDQLESPSGTPNETSSFREILTSLRQGTPYAISDSVIIEPCDINVDLTTEQFCFLTDTNISGIIANIDLIKTFPIIIVECTFYKDDELQHAIDKTHIHWFQIEPLIREHSTSLWVLIHHSQRYKDVESIKDTITGNFWDSTSSTFPNTTIPASVLQMAYSKGISIQRALKTSIPSNCLIWAPSRSSGTLYERPRTACLEKP